VVISARDSRYLDKVMTLDPGEPQDKLRGGWPSAETKPTRTVTAGDRVGSLEVIASPGHTPGHVSFLDIRDRTLYSGDAYSTLGGVATAAKGHPWFPLVTMATWHKPTALESAKALRTLDPARLAPGHGKVVESPAAAMDTAIKRAS
jgi:glyoxylase-like metal-dependent hydrolase (beta-lactamase superfamily II)